MFAKHEMVRSVRTHQLIWLSTPALLVEHSSLSGQLYKININKFVTLSVIKKLLYFSIRGLANIKVEIIWK
jgi:hypothetical protein